MGTYLQINSDSTCSFSIFGRQIECNTYLKNAAIVAFLTGAVVATTFALISENTKIIEVSTCPDSSNHIFPLVQGVSIFERHFWKVIGPSNGNQTSVNTLAIEQSLEPLANTVEAITNTTLCNLGPRTQCILSDTLYKVFNKTLTEITFETGGTVDDGYFLSDDPMIRFGVTVLGNIRDTLIKYCAYFKNTI